MRGKLDKFSTLGGFGRVPAGRRWLESTEKPMRLALCANAFASRRARAPLESLSAALRPTPLRFGLRAGMVRSASGGSPFGASPCGDLLRTGYSAPRRDAGSHRWEVLRRRSAQDDILQQDYHLDTRYPEWEDGGVCLRAAGKASWNIYGNILHSTRMAEPRPLLLRCPLPIQYLHRLYPLLREGGRKIQRCIRCGGLYASLRLASSSEDLG